MFAYELPLNPPYDDWKEYRLPRLCASRIEDICKDILKRGEDTNYAQFYDALYQMVEESIEDEKFYNFEI